MIYQFDQFTLDTDQYRLKQGDETLTLEPLVFDLLAYLVKHRDRVVTRKELLENLWKGRVVTDAALGSRLKDTRRIVGDSGSKQAVIKTLHGRGYQFIAEARVLSADVPVASGSATREINIGLEDQSPVNYCRSIDGVSIAHARVGSGYPLVITGSWMTHLQEDWKNPGWGEYLRYLANDYELIRYDQRGNGMSDWDNVEIEFDRMVDDLEAVIDSYEHEKVAIFGPSQAAAVSIAYASRHPDKVSHLILHGGYSRGRRQRNNPETSAESEALVTLIRLSWGNVNPAIRQTYTSLMMPDATREEADWFNEFQRTCGPAENIARFREIFDDIDVVDLLDGINVPTLIAHCIGDSVAPLAEGKLLASRIPGAKFITFNSNNHMMFEHEPEFPRLIKCIGDFLKTAN
jgi:pimeloyl-ACP methyl ester carboxylesterase/DNA-binding winged helix-turn-helix (wHTH) protein